MVMALLSVIATELILTIGINVLPTSVDVYQNIWLLGVAPAVAVVVTLSTLILRKRFAAHLGYGAIYAISYAFAHALELNAFANPIADIVAYVVIILTVSAVIIGGSYWLWWRHPSTAAAEIAS